MAPYYLDFFKHFKRSFKALANILFIGVLALPSGGDDSDEFACSEGWA